MMALRFKKKSKYFSQKTHPEKCANKQIESISDFVSKKESEDVEVELHGQSFDVLTSIIGESGRYQLINMIILGSPLVLIAWSVFVTKFLTQEVDFWCKKPDFLNNMSNLEWINISAPLTDSGSFDRCHIFDVNYEAITERPDEQMSIIPCTEWEFEKGEVENTMIQRHSLVCGKMPYFKSLAQSLYFAGTFVTAPCVGMVADWFGRKRACLIFMGPGAVLWILSYFIDNVYLWLALRFFLGSGTTGFSMSRSVYLVEIVSGKWRSLSENWFGETFFQIGRMSLALLVYVAPDMRNIELVIGCLFGFFWVIIAFLPESPRWLLSIGRFDDAKEIVKKIVKINNLPLSKLDDLDHYTMNEPPRRGQAIDLFKRPSSRRNVLLLISTWFTVGICMNGLTYNTPTFDWSPNLIFCVPAFFLLPAAFILPYLQNRLGRKFLVTFGLVISGVSLLATLVVPRNYFTYNWPILACAWIANTLLDIVWGTLCVYTKEIFPTTHRTMSLGLVSASCMLGSVLSPYVILLDVYDPIFSLIFYSILCLFSGVVSVWIWPETKALKLPDSLEEAEEAASTKNNWLIHCNW